METLKLLIPELPIFVYFFISLILTLYWLFSEWYELGPKAYHADGLLGLLVCAIFTFIFVSIVVTPVEIVTYICKFLVRCKNTLKSIYDQFKWRIAHIKSEIKSTNEEVN